MYGGTESNGILDVDISQKTTGNGKNRDGVLCGHILHVYGTMTNTSEGLDKDRKIVKRSVVDT